MKQFVNLFVAFLNLALFLFILFNLSSCYQHSSTPSTEWNRERWTSNDSMDETEEEHFNTESYNHIRENEFKNVLQNPLSTFSIDVDKASYSNVRRFLNYGQLPPKDAVRIEELINYFDYDYPNASGDTPCTVTSEMAICPWAPDHRLLHIGLKAREIEMTQRPPSNLVFLLDISGSMHNANKLPLLKQAFSLLTDQLNEQDRVAIVTYAGNSGLVLDGTPGDQKATITRALKRLRAGGSTAGARGIELAYEVAQRHFIEGGNNRIILATDGDFNIGPSSEGELVRMIEQKREAGVFLSVLGFGMGNYKDSKMEQLADHGNGNYAYIDQLNEARKVLVDEFSSTLFTVAKDVKLQIEFNPAQVQAYRLIGYENRLLNKEDFKDDTKDAGEMGAGHTVTAIYELIPTGSLSQQSVASSDSLIYQKQALRKNATKEDWLTLKLRYKEIDEGHSRELVYTVKGQEQAIEQASEALRFGAGVAGFGMLLRGSKYKGDCTYDWVDQITRSAKGADPFGYRAEFISLVNLAKSMDQEGARERVGKK